LPASGPLTGSGRALACAIAPFDPEMTGNGVQDTPGTDRFADLNNASTNRTECVGFVSWRKPH
jgi:hypothetical protein